MDSFPIKPDCETDSVATAKTTRSEQMLYDSRSSASSSKSLIEKVFKGAVLASAVATAAFIGSSFTGEASALKTSSDGQVLTSNGDDAAIMNQRIVFPVFAEEQDLAAVLANRDQSEDAPNNGETELFGVTLQYTPLATADEKDIKHFFSHIATTGDGRAECKTKLGDALWNYDVEFPVNGHDPSSNVFFGSGFNHNAIPYVDKPVIIVDCHKSHPGVCIVGEAEGTVLPWNSSSAVDEERKLEASNASGSIEDYKINAKDAPRRLFKDHNGSNKFRRRRMTESFWKLDEVASCWTDSYDLHGFNFNGHSILAAVPSDKSSNCPKISVDAAPFAGNAEDYDKFAMVLDELPEDVIDFKVSMPLRKFYAAVDFARAIDDGTAYDLIQNNCHVFIFDVLAYLKVPYKSKEIKTTMVDYSTSVILQNDKMKTALLNAASEYSVPGNLMRRLRSERSTIRFVATKVIEGHSVDLDNAV